MGDKEQTTPREADLPRKNVIRNLQRKQDTGGIS
jgi:hypothetical protein